MFAFLLTLVCFSSLEVASKPLMPHLHPMVLTFYRFLIGGLFLLAVGMVRRAPFRRLGWRNLAGLSLLGVLNVFCSMSLLQAAVKHSSASLAASVFCTNPVFVLLLAALCGQEKLTLRRAIAFPLGVLGVGIVLNPFENFAPGAFAGVLFAFGAAVLFASYSVAAKRFAAEIDPFVANSVSFLAGTTCILGYGLARGLPFALPSAIVDDPVHLSLFLFLGFVVSGLAYISCFVSLRRFKASAVSMLFFVKPALATVLAWLLLSEPLGLRFFGGLGTIMAAGLLAAPTLRFRGAPRIPPQEPRARQQPSHVSAQILHTPSSRETAR